MASIARSSSTIADTCLFPGGCSGTWEGTGGEGDRLSSIMLDIRHSRKLWDIPPNWSYRFIRQIEAINPF